MEVMPLGTTSTCPPRTRGAQAEAISRYAKQQQYGLEIANDAVEIRLIAERRLGELLKETGKAKGAKGSGSNQHEVRYHDDTTPKLEELGISKLQSSRWQREAALPEDAFQTYVADTRAKGDPVVEIPRLPLSNSPRAPSVIPSAIGLA